ncbi:MAG: hypothetical protein ACOC5F_06455 [Candidatus Aminicenantaceae bacterium]
MNLLEILELLQQVLELEKKIEKEILKGTDARKRKRLYKAIRKAIKSGKDSDLQRVRDLMFKL